MVTAQDGVEALALIVEVRPQVIVLDLMPTGSSGWDFVERCHALTAMSSRRGGLGCQVRSVQPPEFGDLIQQALTPGWGWIDWLRPPVCYRLITAPVTKTHLQPRTLVGRRRPANLRRNSGTW